LHRAPHEGDPDIVHAQLTLEIYDYVVKSLSFSLKVRWISARTAGNRARRRYSACSPV